jgi:tetratricopeptide (TPR) repeat protein
MEKYFICRLKTITSTALFIILCLAVPLLIPSNATGSMPVEKTLTGCVIGNRFFSISFDSQTGKPVKAYPMRIGQNIDLASYEKKTISVDGSLLPGDRFILKQGNMPVIIKETCEGDNLGVIRKEFIMEYRVAAYQAAKKKNFDEALKLVNWALDMDKNLCGTYISRAQIYYLKGDFAAGSADVRIVKDGACVDSQGLNYLILEEMGATLEKSGKKDDAVELYKMGLLSCQSEMCRETMNKNMRKATAQ